MENEQLSLPVGAPLRVGGVGWLQLVLPGRPHQGPSGFVASSPEPQLLGPGLPASSQQLTMAPGRRDS